MSPDVLKIQRNIVARFETIHDGTRIIECPELRAAETASELYAALCILFNRCPAKFPILSVILRFRRAVRIQGELSFDGKPLN